MEEKRRELEEKGRELEEKGRELEKKGRELEEMRRELDMKGREAEEKGRELECVPPLGTYCAICTGPARYVASYNNLYVPLQPPEIPVEEEDWYYGV